MLFFSQMASAALDKVDIDPQETREWLDAFESVLRRDGPERARFLLRKVLSRAWREGLDGLGVTDYLNTIPSGEEPSYPGDMELELRIQNINRWNAAMMVIRAGKKVPGIGGHIATFASLAGLYEVGFNHHFKGREGDHAGDQVFLQGHGSPGIYARAWLEGRLTREQLENFRQEVGGEGLSSYPHPRLMPQFWEFPTVSMGLAPITAIAQARFNRYLQARGIADTSDSHVWAFLGDGETDEPETLANIRLAAREGLDNLTFVINGNLQRLDGPVRGNGKILNELEAVFRASGWNVIKLLWGSDWDPIFEQDQEGVLVQRLNAMVDGDLQKGTADPAYLREALFGGDPDLRHLVEDLSDAELHELRRGGHDLQKIHAAYAAARSRRDMPTVILAQTVKGYGLGNMEAKNVAHQAKSAEADVLAEFRDRLGLEIPDHELESFPYLHPGKDSKEVAYLLERRRELGGFVPARRNSVAVSVEPPGEETYEDFFTGSRKGQEASTTIAFVSILRALLRNKEFGRRLVPIIPDEARTFGMETLFKQIGIYSPAGQQYMPVDKETHKFAYYRESEDGQVFEEGICEAGAAATFSAAGTSYATHGQPMIPIYIFYSMFGFQRTGDQIWQFGDMRGRGFLLGATAGRTTLNGEGLQHEDGHSHLVATTIPNLRAYDPAYAYELAVIIQDGLRRMLVDEEDVFYYITLQNENYAMPPIPGREGVREGILRGLYRYREADERLEHHVQLFGSATHVNTALEAQRLLAGRYGVSADVWSATSYAELRREALQARRWNRLHPEEEPRTAWIQEVLQGVQGPFVAVSDYVKLVPEMIAPWIPGRYVVLGTDGYGMSDSRPALRRHFEVDAASIVVAALDALREEGAIPASRVREALDELDYDPDKRDPMSV